MTRLRLDGPLHTWSDTALLAHLDEEPVMVLLGPDHGREEPDPNERRRGAKWVGREAPGLLPLLEVLPLGPRNAWVHPVKEALGLGHLVDALPTDKAPIRVAAELVASVAETLHRVGPEAVDHPGPHPEDVAVDPDGRTWLVGFGSPWPRSPLYRDPAGGTPQEALVWRLGVLLALLLGGRVPAVSDRGAHEAMVRRVLIRVMSRPGPMFPERYRDWLTGMLAWEADQRPALSSVAEGLREVARGIRGPSLQEWAADLPGHMEALSERLGAEDITRDTEASFHPWNTGGEPTEDSSAPATVVGDIASMGTLPGVPASAFERDEQTAESTMLSGTMPVGQAKPEPGTMPVGVGPPVQAIRHRPSLPHGFLEDVEPEGPLPVDHEPPSRLVQLALLVILSVIAVGLAGLAGVVWYLGT